jgi:hypothetical protein
MRTYTLISGTLFSVVALAHALRLFLGWSVELAGWVVPIWFSGVALLATGVLAIWAFRLVGQVPK